MIVECKICKGSGRVSKAPIDFFSEGEVCPACKGAGEFEIVASSEKLTTCKFCGGTGILRSTPLPNFGKTNICHACKGAGVIERPIIGTGRTGSNGVNIPQTPRLSRYDFDIAVSFAGEDRRTVKKYCDILSSNPNSLNVFFDEYEKIALWGANLYDKLDEVYRTQALFCVIFISKHYAAKVWTNHERKSAQARALQENREHVLPVRLDDTEMAGIPQTIGYKDLREISIEELAEITVQKVRSLKHDTHSPNTT